MNREPTDRLSWTILVDDHTLAGLPDRVDAGSGMAFARHLGCDILQLEGWGTPHGFASPALEWGPGVAESQHVEQDDVICELRGPGGSLASVWRRGHPVKHPVQDLADVHVESSMEAALAALEARRFDVFVSASAEFLSPDRFAVNHRLSAVLDVIGQGVCIIDRDGQVLWANAQLAEFPDEVFERVPVYVVDLTPSDFADSEYSKIRVFVDKQRPVVLRARYWNAAGVEVKEFVAEPDQIRHFDGVWVPMTSTMRNLMLDSYTKRVVTALVPNPELGNEAFDLGRLESH